MCYESNDLVHLESGFHNSDIRSANYCYYYYYYYFMWINLLHQ